MVYVYGLAYYCLDYILKSVHSLRESTAERFNLTVAENHSPNSAIIRKRLESEVKNGSVDTYIAFSENLLSSAIKHAYNICPPGKDSDDFIVITDLDLKVPEGVDWVRELRCRFCYPEVGLVGFDLDPVNYETRPRLIVRELIWKLSALLPHRLAGLLRRIPDAPPWRGHNWGHLFSYGTRLDPKYRMYVGLYSGGWLLGIRKQIYDKFIDTYDTCLDRHLNRFSLRSGYVIGRLPVRLYHYGWDSWKDQPEYYKYKLLTISRFHNDAKPLCDYEIIRKTALGCRSNKLE